MSLCHNNEANTKMLWFPSLECEYFNLHVNHLYGKLVLSDIFKFHNKTKDLFSYRPTTTRVSV